MFLLRPYNCVVCVRSGLNISHANPFFRYDKWQRFPHLNVWRPVYVKIEQD